MKEIKAYLHRHHTADVVHALVSAGFHNLLAVANGLRAGLSKTFTRTHTHD